MSFMTKPAARHPKMPVNALGLTPRDYELLIAHYCGYEISPRPEVLACEVALPFP